MPPDDEHLASDNDKATLLSGWPSTSENERERLISLGIEPLTLTGRDPIINVILRWSEGYTLLVAIGLVLLFNVPVIVTAHLEGVLRNAKLTPDLLGDVGYWNMFHLALLIFAVTSIKFYRAFPRIFYELFQTGTISTDAATLSRYFIRWNHIFDHILVRFLLYLVPIVIGVSAAMTFDFTRSNSWHWPDDHEFVTITSILLWPAYFFVNYIFVQIFVRIVLGFVFMFRFFRQFEINIRVLHPDRCGGLGPIGRFAFLLNGVVFFTGLLVAGGLHSNIAIYGHAPISSMNVLMVLSYLVASVFVVFTPLWSAHRRMREARMFFLNGVSAEFERHSARVKARFLDEGKVATEDLEIINNIREFYQIGEQQPVWPFNTQVLYTFFASVVSPVGVFLFNVFFVDPLTGQLREIGQGLFGT